VPYPDGTPGWFTRDDERDKCFGWLKNGVCLLLRFSDPKLTHYSGKFTHFEPLLEPILPYKEN